MSSAEPADGSGVVDAYLEALLDPSQPEAQAASTPVAPAGVVAAPGPGPAPPAPVAAPPHARGPDDSGTSAPASASRWLRVVAAGDSYALELLCVQEVVRLAPIVAMRGAAPAVLGAMNLRGRIVPVIDLAAWLRVGRSVHGERSRIVVVERADELIGLLVDAVDDVVTLGRDRVEPPLPGNDPGPVLGIARVGATPTVLFDAHALYR
jgi:purine-binding chemotaxis protein CheW